VPRDDRQRSVKVTIDDMKIRAAHPAGADLDEKFVIGWLGKRASMKLKRTSCCIELHHTHHVVGNGPQHLLSIGRSSLIGEP
jgi:hypothetical protein